LIKDNVQFGTWDFEILETDFEITDLEGFGMEDLNFGLDDEDVEEDEAPALKKESIVKMGDVWLLGNHRLKCGDSIIQKDVEDLMGGEKADMCFTDPPYLMGFNGNVHGDGSKSFNSKHGAIKNDKMSREDGDKFINDIFNTIKQFVNGAYYVFFYRLGLDYIFRATDRNKINYRAVIIWNKGNHTLSGSDYQSKYEPIVYGWIKDHNFYGDRSNFDIRDIARTKKNDLHPTMKPIALCAKAINNSSKKNEIVLDLFSGSGSTMIACEQLNRICYMMEIDEKYCQVSIDRYVNFKKNKGKDVFLLKDGKKIPYKEIVKKKS